jgi:ankyrin repeat protein
MAKNKDINKRDKNGRTPLIRAITLGIFSERERGKYEPTGGERNDVVVGRIHNGAKVNKKSEIKGNNNISETVLHALIRSKNIDEASKLDIFATLFLTEKLKFDIQDSHGMTPLNLALESGLNVDNPPLFDLILKHSLDKKILNKIDNEGFTPFMRALQVREFKAVAEMIEIGCKLPKSFEFFDNVKGKLSKGEVERAQVGGLITVLNERKDSFGKKRKKQS